MVWSDWSAWLLAVQVYRVKLVKQGPADSHFKTHSLLSISAGTVVLYLWQPENHLVLL